MSNGYTSKAAAKRGMKAMSEGATPVQVEQAMAERRVTADEFFAHGTEPVANVEVGIVKLQIEDIIVTIVGDAPLITHKWSEKAIKQMQDKHSKKEKTAARPVRDPEQEARDATYFRPDGSYGFPAIAFKNAAVTACTSLKGYMTKVQARQAFHVQSEDHGDLVKIEGTPVMRTDSVTVGVGSADLRYRPEFTTWKTKLRVRFNRGVLTAAQVVNLLNFAGFAVGVGEWRPEKDGQYGLFHVQLED